jgi:hypothetical protein
MNIIGIDPGISGAVAVGNLTDLLTVFDLVPQPGSARGEAPGTGKKAFNLIDCEALANHLARWPSVCVAFVEVPIPGAGNGIRQASQTSRILGRIEGVLAAARIEVMCVHPSKWRGFHGLAGGGDTLTDADAYKGNKERSLDLAVRLYPEASHFFCPPPLPRKDGTPRAVAPAARYDRAEAALIWSYGAHMMAARSR